MYELRAIPYIGSKARLLPAISKNLHEGTRTYCEPFSGGFSLGINLIKLGYLSSDCKIVYNDLDTALYNYFKCVKDNYKLLIDEVEFVTHTILDEFSNNEISVSDIVYDLKSDYIGSNDIYKQSALYYLIKKSNKGSYKEYVSVTSTVNLDYLDKTLCKVSDILQGVELLNKGYKDLNYLDSHDTFWYLDPPYYNMNNSNFYAQCKLDGEFNHIELRDFLKGLKGKFILSYNDCAEVRELYKDFKIHDIKMISKLNKKGETSELLISNYDIDILDIKFGASEIGKKSNKNRGERNNEIWDIPIDEFLS